MNEVFRGNKSGGDILEKQKECPVCGGNSSSAIEGQIRWLSEISNDK